VCGDVIPCKGGDLAPEGLPIRAVTMAERWEVPDLANRPSPQT